MQLSNQPITWQLLHLGVWSWSRQSPELQTECQNGKERWFKQFWALHGCWCL